MTKVVTCSTATHPYASLLVSGALPVYIPACANRSMSTSPSSAAPPPVLDSSSFPHIVAHVLEYVTAFGSPDALPFRLVCRKWNRTITSRLFKHVTISSAGDMDAVLVTVISVYGRTAHFQPFDRTNFDPSKAAPLTSCVRIAVKNARVLDIAGDLPPTLYDLFIRRLSRSTAIRIGPQFQGLTSEELVSDLVVLDLHEVVFHDRSVMLSMQAAYGAPNRPYGAYGPPGVLAVRAAEGDIYPFLVLANKWPEKPESITIICVPSSPAARVREDLRQRWLASTADVIFRLAEAAILTFVSGERRDIEGERKTESLEATNDAAASKPSWSDIKRHLGTLREQYRQSGVDTERLDYVRFMSAEEYEEEVGEEQYRIQAFLDPVIE